MPLSTWIVFYYGDYAIIHLDSFLLNADMGRYSFIICQLLRFSGFNLVIKLDPAFLNKERYKKLLLEKNYCFVRSTGTAVNTIQLQGRAGETKIINLIYGFRYVQEPINAWNLPYTMHPRFYINELSKKELMDLRQRKRKVSVFFAGNMDGLKYDDKVIHEKFGMLSRGKIISHIKNKYKGDEKVKFIGSEAHLSHVFNLMKSDDPQMIISVARTDPDKWLEILGNSDFFICLPGVRMPWSHNALEAMSVGTIPILEYGNLFNPPLAHGKNCILYHNYEEFDQAIEMALNMERDKLEATKNNVIAYYDQHLSTEMITHQLKDFYHSKEKDLNIVMPYLDN